MRTPKLLYPQEAIKYSCELENCPHCQGPLVDWYYQSSCKTVQTLTATLCISHQAKRCADQRCLGHQAVFKSARWQQLAPEYGTYGYDVIGQIGICRQEKRFTFHEIHQNVSELVRISLSQVRYLYHYSYLPLLACHERSSASKLQNTADESGLILSLDGLAPEGGEAQLWFVRELQTGLTLRSGWLSEQSEVAFVNFLKPIVEMNWSVLAVVSDKQRGLVGAIQAVFPDASHGLCQMHYLKNLAEPIAAIDNQLKVTLRKSIRNDVGDLIRGEQVEKKGVLTVTGLLPTKPDTPCCDTDEMGGETPHQPTDSDIREACVTDILRRVRYLLTLKGRPPFRLAGIEMYNRLKELTDALSTMLAHHNDDRLVRIRNALRQNLCQLDEELTDLQFAESWLHQIAQILDPEQNPPRCGLQVKAQLNAFLDQIPQTSGIHPPPQAEETASTAVNLSELTAHLEKVTASYAPGLFHTYDIPGLPRTNNELESEFRDLQRRHLRTTGQVGLTRRMIHRNGAWELLPRPSKVSDLVEGISRVDDKQFRLEQTRIRNHHQRFALHTRSTEHSQKRLDKLVQQWKAL